MAIIRGIIIFSTVTIINCQYDYYRPDIQAKELGYNVFGQPFALDEGNRGGEIPGQAGTDYPAFSEVPETGFRCDQQRYPGYFADPATGCQAFHICQRDGRSDSFLCPNGTIFDQEWLVCDWYYNFDCSRAEDLYSVNEQVVRSMEEAEIRLQDYRYNDLRRFGNNRVNGDLDFQGFPNSRNGFTPLNSQNDVFNRVPGGYGVPGAPGFERNAGNSKFNRRSPGFGRFPTRNGERPRPAFFEAPVAPGFQGANGYSRNLFRGDAGTLDRNYLPPGK